MSFYDEHPYLRVEISDDSPQQVHRVMFVDPNDGKEVDISAAVESGSLSLPDIRSRMPRLQLIAFGRVQVIPTRNDDA